MVRMYLNGSAAPIAPEVGPARITVDLPVPLWEAMQRVGHSIVAHDVADHDSLGELLRELRAWAEGELKKD